MQFLLEHGSLLISLLTIIFGGSGLVATWTRMTVRLSQIEERILENRDVMKNEIARFQDDLSTCREDHTPCHQATVAHHQDTLLHFSRQERDLTNEWRHDVTSRLKAIEDLLRELKRNGGR